MSHAWILYAELFVSGERAAPCGNQKGFRIDVEVESVRAARQANDGPASTEMRTEKHDVLALMLYYRRVVDRFHWVRDFCLGEDGIVAISPDHIRLHDCFFSSKSKIVE